jgi:hypothetical protein
MLMSREFKWFSEICKVRPSEDKITAEILYNKYDILQNFHAYLLAAILMLLFTVIEILKKVKR